MLRLGSIGAAGATHRAYSPRLAAARALLRAGRVLGSARLHDERLVGVADDAALVVQDPFGDRGPALVQARARVEPDPLALRLAVQVDRQVGVDEKEAVEAQRG